MKSPPYFCLQYIQTRWRYRKILWPSQNIWTLKPYWPEKTFIVFMFSQTFDWRHQNIIISKEIVQNEFWKTITETSILCWIQNNNLYRNVQLKRKSQVFHQNIAFSKLSFVISHVFKICLPYFTINVENHILFSTIYSN